MATQSKRIRCVMSSLLSLFCSCIVNVMFQSCYSVCWFFVAIVLLTVTLYRLYLIAVSFWYCCHHISVFYRSLQDRLSVLQSCGKYFCTKCTLTLRMYPLCTGDKKIQVLTSNKNLCMSLVSRNWNEILIWSRNNPRGIPSKTTTMADDDHASSGRKWKWGESASPTKPDPLIWQAQEKICRHPRDRPTI